MKKQSGFTLIELMVVMAIIAILATAGLAAYTGYIKKARDATRIADLAAINSIVLSAMASSWTPPATGDMYSVIRAANANVGIADPLYAASSSYNYNCYSSVNTSTTLGGTSQCVYSYYLCDAGTGYALSALFESPANTTMYNNNASGGSTVNSYYDIGSCSSYVASSSTTLY